MIQVSRPLDVLLVEDSAIDAELIERELRLAGLEFVTRRISSLEELDRALDQAWPDLVLSDFTLPGFGGLEALRVVRERRAPVPFLFVSGTIGEDRAIEALKQGATDYILKDRLARLVPAIARAFEDVAERERRSRAEAALKESELRYRLVARATSDAVWDWDLTNDRILWNDGTRPVLDYPAEEVETTGGWWAERIHPDDRERVLAGMNAACQGTASAWHDEYRFRRRDDSYAYVLDRSYIVRDEAGVARRMVGAIVDMTQRRSLEEQLLQAQKMEAIGRLAGGVAHDFNNLLGVIVGCAELAMETLPASSPAREELLEISRAANRAAGLTSRLLAFARRQVVEPTSVDLNQLLEGMAEMLRRLIGANIVLDIRLHPSPVWVFADAGQLEQVVMNLVINARDAMPDGGKLTIETDVRPAVEMVPPPGATSQADCCVLVVRDTGIGMSEQVRSRIFEPFFSTKEAGKGTGLGLPTCHGIITQSGGEIVVHSAPGAGASFEVRLPRHQPAEDAAIQESSSAPLQRGVETILLVEDEAALQAVAARVLRRLGYRVLVAGTGPEAVRVAAESAEHIDLLITDMVLPGVGGQRLATVIRRLQPGVKVLYMSGYVDSELTPDFRLEAGARFLQKPFTLEALAAKVRQVLDTPMADQRNGRMA